jgi:hypothetical protein
MRMNDGPAECAVVVMSSDRYADLWPTFFDRFRQCWPSCPYPVFLGSNTIQHHGHDFVTTLLSGPDRDWSSSARKIITQIPQPYLVVLLEDLLITADVDSAEVVQAIHSMHRHGSRHIQLACRLPADHIDAEGYGVIHPGAPYRVNVCGLWRKDAFLDLLIDGESPWNFEIMGSYRSRYVGGFLRARRSPIQLLNLVEKGLFLPAAVAYCRRKDIALPLETRGTLGVRQGLVSWLQRCWFHTVVRVPWRLRVFMMNVLRKLLVSY